MSRTEWQAAGQQKAVLMLPSCSLVPHERQPSLQLIHLLLCLLHLLLLRRQLPGHSSVLRAASPGSWVGAS